MKKASYLLWVVGAALCMNACGGASKDMAATEAAYDYGVQGATGEMNYATEEAGSTMDSVQKQPANENTNRKLIRNVSLDVETKDYDSLMVNIESEINALGGYMEAFDSYNGGYYDKSGRNASIVARIPAAELDSFVNKVGEVANITNRSESVDDVTLRYVDMDAHKRMLQEEQERLLVLLESAASIEDIITIESRLSEVRYQIESMESQLRTIDNQVEYSTVRIHVNEVKELTPVVEKSAGDRIKEGFSNSLKSIGHGFKEAGIGFVIYLPFIVLWIIIAAALYFFVRFIVKVCEKKAEKNAAKKQQNTTNTAQWITQTLSTPTNQSVNTTANNGQNGVTTNNGQNGVTK